MTTLLLIRHGQSEANLTRCFAGHLDAPLTDLGHKQAECTAEFIAGTYKVDAVYGSDLLRAFDTGVAVARKTGLSVHPEPRMREIDAGKWEGIPFATLETEFHADYSIWLTDIGNSRPTDGETVEALSQRIHHALRTIAEENPGTTVVVATHATPIRVTQWKLSGQPLSYMKEIPWVSNASVTELFYEDGVFRLGKIAQDDHLAELKTSLPANV